MKTVRLWSIRNAGWLKKCYALLEGTLALFNPLLKAIGHERLDKPFAAVEGAVKGFLFDSQSCGQCTLGETGMACPMNCPKTLRNGPCGGVRQNGGCEINSPPRLFLGGAANPFAPPLDFRPHRMAKKIAAGAQFIQTQYCFDMERMKTFMAQVRDMGLLEKGYVLAGVGPLASAKAAEWIRKNVAGVHIPDDVIKRLAGAENQKQEGVDLCVDLIEQVREIEGVSGVHIMAYRMEDRIGEIVTRSNALGGREPWRPAA